MERAQTENNTDNTLQSKENKRTTGNCISLKYENIASVSWNSRSWKYEKSMQFCKQKMCMVFETNLS